MLSPIETSKQDWLLTDQDHMSSQVVELHFDIVVDNNHPTLGRIVPTPQQSNDDRFSTSRWAYQGHGRRRLNLQINSVEELDIRAGWIPYLRFIGGLFLSSFIESSLLSNVTALGESTLLILLENTSQNWCSADVVWSPAADC